MGEVFKAQLPGGESADDLSAARLARLDWPDFDDGGSREGDPTLRARAIRRNTHRAGIVARLLAEYAAMTLHGDQERESAETIFQDMLSDARHLADAMGLDWEHLTNERNYAAEIEGQ